MVRARIHCVRTPCHNGRSHPVRRIRSEHGSQEAEHEPCAAHHRNLDRPGGIHPGLRLHSEMAAGKYQISWNQIDVFFPMNARQMPPQQPMQQEPYAYQPYQPNTMANTATVDVSKWNWGAFALYPIWGFFNGCWWAFLIAMFLWWLSPIPNIIFGVYGTRWAWQNKTWSSAADFMSTQHSWGIAGIIVFAINILSILGVFIFYAALLSAL